MFKAIARLVQKIYAVTTIYERGWSCNLKCFEQFCSLNALHGNLVATGPMAFEMYEIVML